ncbi:unnamed protein product [Pieris brassicae]|uniref:Uncharacterized protein n=1 Tax=Pieris brassicae TaxID=7116 RepID=A0A9P0TI02_PIEBR|nr:unnamed protein product [Pieris brassicae]
MLHNATTRVHFVECWLSRLAEYLSEARYRGAPTREPATAGTSRPIRTILSFRYHIWYCAAGSLRAPSPLCRSIAVDIAPGDGLLIRLTRSYNVKINRVLTLCY